MDGASIRFYGPEPKGDCGYFYTGQAMAVYDDKGRPAEFVLGCARKGLYRGKPLPPTGSTCRIQYRVWDHQRILYESMKATQEPDMPMAVVETLACEPPPVLENAVILEYGSEPPGSGILATYRDLKVRTEAGAVFDMVMPWAGDGAYFGDKVVVVAPPVGSVCSITYMTQPLMDWTDEQGRPLIRNIVKQADCRPPA